MHQVYRGLLKDTYLFLYLLDRTLPCSPSCRNIFRWHISHVHCSPEPHIHRVEDCILSPSSPDYIDILHSDTRRVRYIKLGKCLQRKEIHKRMKHEIKSLGNNISSPTMFHHSVLSAMQWGNNGRENFSLTLTAIFSTKAATALTMSWLTLTIPTAAIWTALGHFFGNTWWEYNFLRVTIIVVQRQKPMALFDEFTYFLGHSRLQKQR